MKTHPDYMDGSLIPWWLVLNAFRFALGRQSYVVSETASWLELHWPRIPERAKEIIKRDLEEAFKRDDEVRAQGGQYKPLGMDMDRKQWERVRALYQEEGA